MGWTIQPIFNWWRGFPQRDLGGDKRPAPDDNGKEGGEGGEQAVFRHDESFGEKVFGKL